VREELLHILALLTLECSVAEAAVAWAVGAITADQDTEAIRVLAGLSPNDVREEIAPWLLRAAHDVGVRIPTRDESHWILTLSEAQEARDLVLSMAAGRVSLIDGSWKLTNLPFAFSPGDAEWRTLFTPFLAVTSETDDLPLGADRVNWDEDVLRGKDAEARAYEESLRADLIPACEALAARIDRDLVRVEEFFSPPPARWRSSTSRGWASGL
jgi:hypothetical protein